MRLEATFPKTPDGRNVAEYRWSDGNVATSPSDGRPARLPHDVGHYIIESRVDLPYGFWALAGRQMPFKTFTLISGAWKRGARDHLDRIIRKHPGGMLQAEAAGFVESFASGQVELSAWPTIRQRVARAYTYEGDSPFGKLEVDDVGRIVEFHRHIHRMWEDVPINDGLRLTWPPAGVEIVSTFDFQPSR